MPRTVTEQHRYTREDLEAQARFAAKMAIISPNLYVGDFEEQRAEWQPDGSLIVLTTHTPGSLEDWRKPKEA